MKMQPGYTQSDVNKLIGFIEAGGPEECEYDQLTNIWNGLKVKKESLGEDILTSDQLSKLFGDQFLHQTIHGLSYRKPNGYAGDYQVIDMIYQQKINEDKRFKKWDKYFQAHKACQAVRNRKNYFINLLKNKCTQLSTPLRVLNIASGPCRDVLEFFEQIHTDMIKIHCIDVDPNAINYAKDLLSNFAGSVEFTRQNIFKFTTENQFDIVWSAGLFDYFTDDDFVMLLARINTYCTPAGEIIIGNFSVSNPSRAYMEKGLEWYLHHRTREQLRTLALRAGFKEKQISIHTEPLGINLFLHINIE